MVDQRVGLTPLDWQFARWLSMKNKPTLLISNKSDGNVSPLDEVSEEDADGDADADGVRDGDGGGDGDGAGAKDVKKLGLGNPLHISATQNEGMSEVRGDKDEIPARHGELIRFVLAADHAHQSDHIRRGKKKSRDLAGMEERSGE
eukprot:213610-Hanusia_phi.AAC.1